MKAPKDSRVVKLYNWLDERNDQTISSVPEYSASLAPLGKKTRQIEDNLKPESVLVCSTAKKGVDKSDQQSTYRVKYKMLTSEVSADIAILNASMYKSLFSLSPLGHPTEEVLKTWRCRVNVARTPAPTVGISRHKAKKKKKKIPQLLGGNIYELRLCYTIQSEKSLNILWHLGW